MWCIKCHSTLFNCFYGGDPPNRFELVTNSLIPSRQWSYFAPVKSIIHQIKTNQNNQILKIKFRRRLVCERDLTFWFDKLVPSKQEGNEDLFWLWNPWQTNITGPPNGRMFTCYFCRVIKTKSWLNITRRFIPKKIQLHIHTGQWSLVDWMLRSTYGTLYKRHMNINDMARLPWHWHQPLWWLVYQRDTPTSPFPYERRGFACM